jgi:hypothetical protein
MLVSRVSHPYPPARSHYSRVCVWLENLISQVGLHLIRVCGGIVAFNRIDGDRRDGIRVGGKTNDRRGLLRKLAAVVVLFSPPRKIKYETSKGGKNAGK